MDKLETAVREQLGGDEQENSDTLRDVASHGADGGFSGFIYYTETAKFYDDNAEAIWDALHEDANEIGQNILELIASFNGAKDVGSDNQFKNQLAWYALERVASSVASPRLLNAASLW